MESNIGLMVVLLKEITSKVRNKVLEFGSGQIMISMRETGVKIKFQALVSINGQMGESIRVST